MKHADLGTSNGTGFHGVTVFVTPNDLKKVAEKFVSDFYECNDGRDKSNFDFEFSTEDGDKFVVYDWKEYRPLDMNTRYDFHIGAKNKSISADAKAELMTELGKIYFSR